jgi:hypothetical protein
MTDLLFAARVTLVGNLLLIDNHVLPHIDDLANIRNITNQLYIVVCRMLSMKLTCYT